ncbi:flavodoxin [Nocardia vinacea]|uniref:flavodoxin n=1 Tax=Nocardia vinacea TaxID=96468 RepID=UPI0034125BAA
MSGPLIHSVARRAVLAGGLAAALALSGACSSDASVPAPSRAPRQPSPVPGGRVLLAYFSRAGMNYHYGGRRYLQVGNTEVLTGLISATIRCDVHRIEPVEPYPDDYEATVARNVDEQDGNARPGIANSLDSIAGYDTIILASGIWNARAPMIMTTFTERYDFTGKTVLPVTTYAVSGLGRTETDYAASCRGAVLGEGLAVRGEEVATPATATTRWLQQVGLTPA